MKSRVQELAEKISMSRDEFVGEMRKRGCSEPTALKIWRGDYENFNDFKDNDMNLSNLRKAAYVLRVMTGALFPSDGSLEIKADSFFSSERKMRI